MKKDGSIILIGIKHSGKTSLGKQLAEHYGLPFVDIDFVIEKMTGKPPRQLYAEEGAGAFMYAEENACRKAAELIADKNAVIATGGGICDNPPALTFLRPLGKFVYLCVEEKIAADRIMAKVKKLSSGVWQGLPAYIAARLPETEAECRAIFHTYFIERTAIYAGIAERAVNLGNNFSLNKGGNLSRIIDALEK